MADEAQRTDPVESLARWMKVFAIAAALAVLALVATIAITRTQLADQRSHDEKDRIERSVGSCKQQNATFIHDHNAFVRKEQANWRLIASALHDPESKKFALDLAESYAENIIPRRDCSPAGIEKYLRELNG